MFCLKCQKETPENSVYYIWANKNDDYWCALLGPGGEIWDDPSYENFSDGETTNLDRCEELLEFGDWVDTRNFNKSSGVVM